MIIILALIFSSALALYFNRKIIATVPFTTCFVLVLTYLMALSNHLNRAVAVCIAALLVLTCLVFWLYSKAEKKTFSANVKSWLNKFKDAEFLIFVVLAVLLYTLYRNHFVTNWDDFNYWANFTKNITVLDTFVCGPKSATIFKDYTPMVQLFSYLVMKVAGGFSEHLMFFANNLLLLIFMVPFFESRKIPAIMSGMVIIPALSFQPIHCLGVDIIIAVIFGYLLIRIVAQNTRDMFFYLEMSAVLAVLVLVKSVSVIVALTVIALLIVDGIAKNKKIPCVILFCSSAVVSFLSWKIFCDMTGNVSYLTKAAGDSVKGGAFLTFPDYGMEVVIQFFARMFTMPLNLGSMGMTVFFCIIFIVAVTKSFLIIKNTNKSYFVIILIGYAISIIGVLYTYLFVFEKWEAVSLSSYDRYISMYMIGPVLLAAYIYTTIFFADKRRAFMAYALPLTLLLSLNYPMLFSLFGPDGFKNFYSEIDSKRTMIEERVKMVFEENPQLYGNRVVIVLSSPDDELEKYLQYGFVPSVTYIEYIEDDDEKTVREKITEHNALAAYLVDENKIIKLES